MLISKTFIHRSLQEYFKQPTPVLSVQSSDQTDAERCTQLLTRRYFSSMK